MTYYTRFPACGDVASKGTVLLLHDQTSSPSVWIQTETMQVLSSSGYTCIAIDLTRIYVEDEKRLFSLYFARIKKSDKWIVVFLPFLYSLLFID
jgi:hypothetical protein